MKKNLYFATLILGAAAMAQAQTQTAAAGQAAMPGSPAPAPAAAPAPPPTRIATIAFQPAVMNTKEGKAAVEALNAKFAPRKTDFDRRQGEIQSLQDQLKKGAATMSEDAKARLERDIDTKTKAYQRDTQDANDDMEQEGNKFYGTLAQKMIKIVQEYASQNGYAAVIDVSSQQTPVVWAAPSADITADMIRLYDQANPVTAAPAAAKPAAPSAKPPAVPAAKPPAAPAGQAGVKK